MDEQQHCVCVSVLLKYHNLAFPSEGFLPSTLIIIKHVMKSAVNSASLPVTTPAANKRCICVSQQLYPTPPAAQAFPLTRLPIRVYMACCLIDGRIELCPGKRLSMRVSIPAGSRKLKFRVFVSNYHSWLSEAGLVMRSGTADQLLCPASSLPALSWLKKIT